MGKELSIKAKIYIASIATLAITLVVYLSFTTDWDQISGLAVLFFLLLTFFSDSFPVSLPRGGIISVSFAITFAALLIFQPLVVVAITVLGDLLSLRKGRNRLVNYIFNASELTVSVGAGALTFNFLNPYGTVLTLEFFLAMLAALVVCFVFNSVLVTLILSFTQYQHPFILWQTNMKWSAPNFFAMAPLGVLIALIYQTIGLWGVVLFLLPLAVARYSFQAYVQVRQTFLDTIQSLSVALEAKDAYTKGHSARVADYAVKLAREMKWPEDRVEFFEYVASVHDVGKIAVPEGILNKEAQLSEVEFDRMKEHPVVGADILQQIKFFQEGSHYVRYHHERWDGKGYPEGLSGENIPEGARILAVVDAFDAMTSDRPYRQALTVSVALDELRRGAGTQFDPEVVEKFEKILPGLDLDDKDWGSEGQVPHSGVFGLTGAVKNQ